MNINSPKYKLLLIVLSCIACLVMFLEICEQKNSTLKSWLYEKNTTKELMVATIAMTPDKKPYINRDKIVSFINNIKETQPNVDLIIFGEAILGWYRSESDNYHKEIAEIIPDTTTQLVAALAKENNVYISFGMAEKVDEKVYNSQVLINDDGEIINVQRKKNLRSKYFDPGQESISIVDIKGVATGVVICYDIQWKETLAKARDQKAELIIISNADYTDEWDNKYFAYKYIAKQFNAWIVTANRFGIENETSWDGHIEIINPIGDLVVTGKSKEQFIMYCIKINNGQSISKNFIRKVYSKISLGYLILKNIKIVYHYI